MPRRKMLALSDPAYNGPSEPDWADPSFPSWIAWPGRADGAAEELPPGVAPTPIADRPADCFFLVPTTYGTFSIPKELKWNMPPDDRAANSINATCMAEQAGCFNVRCRVYAPRYRQIGGHALGQTDTRSIKAARELAYADCRAAFRYYIAHHNAGRPFIVAGHSQGSGHALRLVAECIEGTPLMGRFIAGYIIGASVPMDVFGRNFHAIHPCRSPTDTRCIISYNTIPEAALERRQKSGGKGAAAAPRPVALKNDAGAFEWVAPRLGQLAVNPLTWRPGSSAASHAHLGLLYSSMSRTQDNPYRVAVEGVSLSRGFAARVVGGAVVVPLPAGHLPATAGSLAPLAKVSKRFAPMPTGVAGLGGTLHNEDYALFYFNIRENVRERVDAFIAGARL